MEKCIIEGLKDFAGLKGELKGQTFSNYGLDKLLIKHKSELEAILAMCEDSSFSKIFSQDITNFQIAVANVDRMNGAFDRKATKLKSNRHNQNVVYYAEDGSFEVEQDEDSIMVVKNSIPMTKLSDQFGGKEDLITPLNPPFTEAGYRDYLEARDERIKGLEGDEREEVIQNILKQGKIVTSKLGTETHAVISAVSDPTAKTKIPVPVVANRKHLQTDKEPDKGNDWGSTMKNIGSTIISKFKAMYGENCKIYSELPIISKSLDPTVASKLTPTHSGDTSVDYIVGVIDFLVIDEKGNGHIFDIKTSRKVPGDWGETDNKTCRENNAWVSTVKRNYTFQVAGYAAICSQWGLNIEDCNIIPIWLDMTEDSKGRLDKLNGITMQEWITDLPNTTFISNNNIADRISSLIPPDYFEEELDSLEKANNAIASLFPSVSKLKEAKRIESTVEFYKKNRRGFIKPFKPRTGNKDDELKAQNGIVWVFEKENPQRTKVYCTKDNLDEKLKEYVIEKNEHDSKELTSLGRNLYSAMTSTDKERAITKLLDTVDNKAGIYITNQFKKYITQGGWTFIKNDNYTNNGVFIFRNGSRIEIVIVDPRHLGTVEHLEKGSTILGNTLKDSQVDTTEFLPSQYGYLLLMKAAAIVACNHDDLLKNGAKISQVRAINPFDGTEYNILNSILISNWNRLVEQNQFWGKKELDLPTLDSSYFMNDTQACMALANDIYRSNTMEISGFKKLKIPLEESEITEKAIDRLIFFLEEKSPGLKNKDNINRDDPVQQIYEQLLRAKLYLHGIHVVIEPDVGTLFDHGVPAGLWETSINASRSANARILGRIYTIYDGKVSEMFTKYSSKWQILLDNFYKEAGHSKAIGNERPLFTEWLRTDEHGNLDSRFLFRDKDDPYWKSHPAAWAAASYFMETVFRLKYGRNSEEKKKLYEDEFYEVPIVEQAFIARLREAGVQDTWHALKDKIKEVGNLAENTFGGKKEYKEEWEKEKSGPVYNKYLNLTAGQREALLHEKGIQFCEKDLDIVFGVVVNSGCATEVSKDYNILWNGLYILLKMAVKKAEAPGNKPVKMKNIMKFIDEFITNRIYLNPIIEKSMQPAAQAIAVLKQITSHMALGFKTSSMFKEALQSGYTVISRTLAKNVGSLSTPLETKELLKQLDFMVSETPKNISKFSFVQQLSRRYSMANYSASERSGANRSAYWGLLNINSNVVFETSAVMDFFYRNAILLTQMVQDGCRDAYYLKDDGTGEKMLTYDMFKDKRFSAAKLVGNELQWNENDPNYVEQIRLYNKQMNQFIQEGKTVIDNVTGEERLIEMGDILPDAYTMLQAASIREDAQILLGYFDSGTKSLMLNTFWGSLFMQYKTFISAKFEQNFALPHKTNQLEWVQQYDDKGKPVWVVYCSPEEAEEKKELWYFISESDPDFEKIKNDGKHTMEPYQILEGRTIEGTLVQTFEFAKALLTANQEELDELWKDPIKRGRLTLFFMDNVGMLLIAGLIKLIYGNDKIDNMKTMDWFTRWSYAILIGSTRDGPIWQIMDGLVGDFRPPLVGSLQRLASTTTSLINGNINLAEASLGSFGATRELTSFINRE